MRLILPNLSACKGTLLIASKQYWYITCNISVRKKAKMALIILFPSSGSSSVTATAIRSSLWAPLLSLPWNWTCMRLSGRLVVSILQLKCVTISLISVIVRFFCPLDFCSYLETPLHFSGGLFSGTMSTAYSIPTFMWVNHDYYCFCIMILFWYYTMLGGAIPSSPTSQTTRDSHTSRR